MKHLLNKNVLIVDDEIDLREIMLDEFQALGATVTLAGSGNEAAELLAHQSFDLVLSDIRMPNGDGIQLLKKAKNHPNQNPLFFLMTGESQLSVEDALHNGAEGFFYKPFQFEKMMKAAARGLQTPSSRWVQIEPQKKDLRTFEIEMSDISVGRGGFFVASNSPLPTVGESLAFNIRILHPTQESEVIQGTGHCCWIRAQADSELRRGFGLEIESISHPSLERVVKIVQEFSSLPYVPKN